jgi:hypothetical protein
MFHIFVDLSGHLISASHFLGYMHVFSLAVVTNNIIYFLQGMHSSTFLMNVMVRMLLEDLITCLLAMASADSLSNGQR